MTESTTATRTVQVHRVFIKAPAQLIWDAITEPEWNRRYGYQAPSEYDLRPGGTYTVRASKAMADFGAPDVIIEGEVITADPPHKLVQTWRPLFSPEMAAEGPTRVTWEIDELPMAPAVCRVTITHELDDAPTIASQVAGDVPEAGGGWPMILSDLKTMLETGKAFQE